jgi:two-component system, chemotaxis family, response regulator Rcp1
MGRSIAYPTLHSMQHPGRPVELLVIEDNPAAAQLTRDALSHCDTVSHVTVALDGMQAMQVLREETPGRGRRRKPDAILLSLSDTPGDGHDLLKKIKADQELRRIPVLVLGGADTAGDVPEVYSSHANCYIRKPANPEQLVDVVRAIERFWFGIVTLPAR